MENLAERIVARRLNQHVNVIGHDDECVEEITFADRNNRSASATISAVRRSRNRQLPCPRSSQCSRSSTKATMIFALGFPVPRFRMKLQPGVLFVAPLREEAFAEPNRRGGR